MREAFYTNVDTALLFFRVRRLYGINDHDGCVRILRAITARKKARYIRDADTFLAGKSVAVVRPTGGNS